MGKTCKRSKKGWRAFEGTGRCHAFLKPRNAFFLLVLSSTEYLDFHPFAIVTPFTLTEAKIQQQQQMDLGKELN